MKDFFLFYNGYLISYKKCEFKEESDYILCNPYWTCSFTKILGGYTYKKSSVIVMLEKIKECFKGNFYFPIFVFDCDESCDAFLKNGFKIVLIDYDKDKDNKRKILLPTEENINIFLEKHKNIKNKVDYLLGKILKEKELTKFLLPKENKFFQQLKYIERIKNLYFNNSCFLIYSPKTTDGKKRKSKKKSKRKKSKKRRKSRN